MVCSLVSIHFDSPQLEWSTSIDGLHLEHIMNLSVFEIFVFESASGFQINRKFSFKY